MDPVGVIGLGLMGSVPVERLRRAGRPVAHDIDPARRDASGAALAHPSAIAAHCGCIALALFDTVQVEDVIERGLVPHIGGRGIDRREGCCLNRIRNVQRQKAPHAYPRCSQHRSRQNGYQP